MTPLRLLTPKPSRRSRALNIIKNKSFSRGKFTLASGLESSFYLDMKPTMFDPTGINLLAELVWERIASEKVDYVGGLEMGAIPLVIAVTMLSEVKKKPIPGLFVRKEIKNHGTKKLIEAVDGVEGKRIVILDDVTTTGCSAMQAVTAVQEAGGHVVMVLAIVDRGEGAVGFYQKEGIPFGCLFTVDELRNS